MLEDTSIYDVAIIGAGPIGLACAIECQKSGLSSIVIEKGCLTNSLYNYPLNMTFFSTSEKLEIGEVPFVCNTSKPHRSEALEYYRRVAFDKRINIRLYEEVIGGYRSQQNHVIITKKKQYQSKNIIIATGFFDIPNYLNIPGGKLAKVIHYYKEPHPFAGRNLAVIGSANSAIDAALESYRKGANVTLIIKGSSISDRVKYWVRPDIENRIKEGAIKAYFNSNLLTIEEEFVTFATPGQTVRLENDIVLAMTGYRPNFSLLKIFGIRLNDDCNRTPDYNPDTMETNVKNIFLAGVICGGMQTHKWFIENSRIHANMIVKKIIND